MNNKGQNIAAGVIATLTAAGVACAVTPVQAATTPTIKPVKCYGVAKKGKNDCGTKAHACSGQATQNYMPSEWKFLQVADCKKAQLAQFKKTSCNKPVNDACLVPTGAAACPAVAMEKCYGIAKKGKNGCGTYAHNCAGLASTNASPYEWIKVAKGTCNNIVGGRLVAPKSPKKA